MSEEIKYNNQDYKTKNLLKNLMPDNSSTKKKVSPFLSKLYKILDVSIKFNIYK